MTASSIMETLNERQKVLESLTTKKILSVFQNSSQYGVKAMLEALSSLTALEKKDLEITGALSIGDIVIGIILFESEYTAQDALVKFLDVFPNWKKDFHFEKVLPLHETLRNGKLDLFDILIKRGADPSQRERSVGENEEGDNILVAAVDCYLHHRFQEAVVNVALDAHQFDPREMSYALVMSAMNKNLGGIRALVRRGADLSFNSKTGQTALSIACFEGSDPKSDEKVEWLLKAKSASKVLNNGWGNSNSPMHYAAYKGKIKTMEMLFEKGAFLDHPKKKNEETPLMTAASSSKLEAIEWLISHGANPKACEIGGNNALHALVLGDIEDAQYEKEHSLPCALALLKAGVPLSDKNSDGKTPLDIAHENGFLFLETLFSEQSLRESLKDQVEQKSKTDKKFDERKLPKM